MTMENILLSKEQEDVQYKLKIHFVSGHSDKENHEPTEYIRQQVERLTFLCAAIADDAVLDEMTSIEQDPQLESKIQTFLQEQTSINRLRDKDLHVKQVKIGQRRDLDFTESLWEVTSSEYFSFYVCAR
jgi:hypothetical protein